MIFAARMYQTRQSCSSLFVVSWACMLAHLNDSVLRWWKAVQRHWIMERLRDCLQ